MDIDRKMNILSGLKYHNYALLITHMDAERFSIEGVEESDKTVFDEPTNIFKKRCKDYREHLKEIIDKFMEAIGLNYDIDFGAFMYNPCCFVAFGDNDNVSFVAVDEFDAAARLCSLEDLPIRQTCLAFCPELESLGLKEGENQNIFCELSDIYEWEDKARKKKNHVRSETLGRYFQEKFEEIDIGEAVDPSPFFKERPLMAVTYFKLSGMAVLGSGLMMQEYVYKVMADRIKKTLKELSKKANDLTDILPFGKDDVDSFRCMFLDPQGWSDVATLMFCRNYSVIASVVAALRFLTFEELYDESKKEVEGKKRGSDVSLEEAVRSFGIHEAFADRVDNKAAAEELLRKNHVFCSAYTTLSLYNKAFDEKETPKAGKPYHYNGVLMADTNLNVCSGHIIDARDEAEKREKAIEKFKSPTGKISDKYLWFVIGHNDIVYQQLAGEAFDTKRVVELSHLVRQIKSIWEDPPDKDSGHQLSRDIQDICTDLRIPIPVLPKLMQKVDESEHMELRRTLYTLRKDLFEDENGHFDLKTLSNKMNIIRVPSPLSSGIMYLYTDFANYLTDAFLFDSVLDLYDIFTALYRLLTEELPNSLEEKLYKHMCKEFGEDKAGGFKVRLFEGDGHKNGEEEDEDLRNARNEWQGVLKKRPELRADLDAMCLNFLSTDDLEELVELIELMQNALSNRVQISFSAAERWNVTVDARGIGLDRITSAADAPLKCGLGMLRRVMNKKDIEAKEIETGKKLTEEEEDEINVVNRTKIGGASKITYSARAFSKRLVIGGNQDIFLASVDLNIAHLARPRAFYIHLHETAHLISYLLRDKGKCQHGDYQCAVQNRCCHKKLEYEVNKLNDIYLERYQEIFAEMLIHKFVFQSNWDMFFRNYVANYSLDPIAYTGNDDRTTIQMTEVLIRGFLASEPYRREVLYSKPCELTEEIIDEVSTDFWKKVESVGSFLNEYSRLWCGPKKKETENYVKEQFKRIFKEAYHPVCCIWGDVERTHGIITENYYPSHKDQAGDGKRMGLDHQIDEGVNSGRPLIRVQYRGENGDKETVEDKRMDALYLICRLLEKHLSSLYTKIKTENSMVYLRRKTNGNPDALALEEGKMWNLRLLDRNFNGIVAADPWTRRKSMRNRITIIKTLWDISTNFRARRMKDMLT